MPIVSSHYWNSVHGFTPDDVRKDKEGLQTMRVLGQNMAWLLKCIEIGKQNGIEKPEYDARMRTHFIQDKYEWVIQIQQRISSLTEISSQAMKTLD